MEKIEGIIEAYRLFYIMPGNRIHLGTGKELVLHSIIEPFITAPKRINEAKHSMDVPLPGVCPHTNKRCGFNMLKYNGSLNKQVLEYPGAFLLRCYGWGKVIPGEYGFRCQYMYPKSIFGYITQSTSYFIQSKVVPIGEPGNALEIKDLWKVARLYKIQLEMELPEWIET